MKKKNTLLWEISGKNVQAPSYLFGTMHVRDNRAFRKIDFLKSCIENCAAFAAEFDLKDADLAQLQQASKLPNGKTLQDFLNPKIYQKLDRLVRIETGQQLEQFKYSSPIILFNLISESQFQADNQMALDSMLYTIAQNANKELMGLETFHEQMAVFSKINIKEQCRSLKKMATHFKRFRKELSKTAELYIQGDIQGLQKKAKRSIGGMRQVLLYERNDLMAERFEQYACQQSLFAAIGAGHLGGKKGVLRLMKKKGYKITPIFY
ncbi:TraB/GumN family protein [Aureispira anguillae]|uniref:TraB/GumN family protein n=1 Tax=Aureispira anguillae TaxID=2864201 RepID=A0A915YFH6_9BACT|nr:TraB/GumN family protein [Aureispira anguillae]BDS12075.1 TraB/GumN family protein [Aureispira anguillae]